MARRKTSDETPPVLTKEAVAAFIAKQTGKVGKREIARAFDVSGSDKVALKAILRELEDDGVIERRGRSKLATPGTLPPVVLADIFERDRDGELIATPSDWDEEHGEAPRILVATPRGRRAGPAPGVGDRALLRIEPNEDEGPAYRGRVIKLVTRGRRQVLGIFRADPRSGGGQIEPVDKKKLGQILIVPEHATGEAQDGDLVAVDVQVSGRFGRPTARVKERLGSLASERAVSLVAIHAHGIPHVFKRDVIEEAEKAKPATLSGREDWRQLPLVTIDPPDAKDHDDAVHAEPDTDPRNKGGFIVTVAIADVAHYVRPHSALDREALERGNSVYFPDRVVPMLPERISNDLCSLRPGEDRPAVAVRMVIAADGRKLSHRFHRVMMRSAAKLAYAQAQAAIEGRTDEATDGLVEPILKPLWAAYRALKTARDAREPLDLELPERKIILNDKGHVERVIVPERLEAHRLIEEMMILANVAAAETLIDKRTPLLFRVHDAPSIEKMTALREFMASIDIDIPKAQVMRPRDFNRLLARVAGTEHQQLVNEVVLRSQAQAEYAADNYGHFGLNLRRYAHFTSPIRRYADLVVHRGLIRAHGFGRDGLPEETTHEQLAEVGASISAAERRAMAAERETVDRLIAHYLADQVGASFSGRISGVTRAGLFVVLSDTGASGFVPAATLGREYFAHDPARQALIGAESGETFRLGDSVRVKLVEAAPVAGALRFEMLSEGRRGSPLGRGKRGLRRAQASERPKSAKGRRRAAR